MFTFLHHVAKPLAEISKIHLPPFWPTKIIHTLLAAANLSTTENQLSATSVLIQQNWHGDNKQNDLASFAEALYEAPTKSERNFFFVTVDFLIHSGQYANTWMAVLIRRVNFFSFWGQRKVLSSKIYLRGLRPCFLHGGALVLFWTATKSATILEIFQVNVHFTHYPQAKYVMKGYLCTYKCFIDVLYIFDGFFKKNWEMCPIWDR